MPRQLPERIRVQVTRDMIHWAMQQKSTQCAVALAIRDADPDGLFERPWVTQERISFTDRYTDRRYTWTDIPNKLKLWIDQFDRDPSKCRAFSFTLEVGLAKVETLQHQTTVQQAIAKREMNARYALRKATGMVGQPRGAEHEVVGTVEPVVPRRQKKLPVKQRATIIHTSKRELRDVVLPKDAGVID